MKHVLALCRVIDLEPVEFLQIALKPRSGQRSPLLRRLQALLPQAGAEVCPPHRPPRRRTPRTWRGDCTSWRSTSTPSYERLVPGRLPDEAKE